MTLVRRCRAARQAAALEAEKRAEAEAEVGRGGEAVLGDSDDKEGLHRAMALTASELAAWTMVANVLLNLDETITKE